MSQHDHDEPMVINGVELGPKHYWKIWGALLLLLIVSFVGPFLGIQVITLMTAFGIAVVKAYLVCKHFMHLDIQPKYVLYALTGSLVLMGLFFFGTAPDVMRHDGDQWNNVAAASYIERTLEEQASAGGHGEAVEGEWVAADEFVTTCGACHGATGAGDGAALDPPPANFTDPTFWETRNREHIIDVITNGGQAVGRSPLMTAFGARFSEEQVEALADHVISLAPEGAYNPDAAPAAEAGETDEAPAPEALPEAAEPAAAQPAAAE